MKLLLTQSSYMIKILERVGLKSNKAAAPPMEAPKSSCESLEAISQNDGIANSVSYRCWLPHVSYGWIKTTYFLCGGKTFLDFVKDQS